MPRKKNKFPKQKQPSVTGVYTDRFGLPSEVLHSLPEIVLRGNREAVLEHCRRLLTYTQQEIAVQSKSLIITVIGESLVLTAMTGDNMRINGDLREIRFSQEEGSSC